MQPQESLIVSRQGAVTTIALNNPEVRNAVDAATMQAIGDAVRACHDDGTRCIVLTGRGGAFCSGLNLKTAMADGFMTSEKVYQGLTEIFHPTLKAIRAFPYPVIAAVDGYAAGYGCDLALTCDMRLVTERARFGELFVRMGLIPDGGATYLLPRMVGLGLAMELMFTTRDVLADEALRIGLASRVYPVEVFEAEVAAFADEISHKSPHALRRGKAAMLAALDGTYDDALHREAVLQSEIMDEPDGLEGLAAFVQKRDPVWK